MRPEATRGGIRKNVEEGILIRFGCHCTRQRQIDAAQLPVASKREPVSFAISYSAAPGNTASILVFNVAALNGLTM